MFVDGSRPRKNFVDNLDSWNDGIVNEAGGSCGPPLSTESQELYTECGATSGDSKPQMIPDYTWLLCMTTGSRGDYFALHFNTTEPTKFHPPKIHCKQISGNQSSCAKAASANIFLFLRYCLMPNRALPKNRLQIPFSPISLWSLLTRYFRIH